MDLFFKIVTEFGNIWFVLCVGLTVAFFYGVRESIRLGFIVGFACFTGFIIKIVVSRPRPDTELALVYASGYSFPSLHALVATVTALYLFFMFACFFGWKSWQRIIIAVGLMLMVALVGWSRVYLGVHYWGDVIAGTCLGIVLYYLLVSLFDKVFKIKLSRECKSVKDTKRLARLFVRHLKRLGHANVLFDAQMGAGKTTFICSVVKGLGARVLASSPTFSVINKYAGNIFHVDLYRLENIDELVNTDFYEIISDENFVFIEWSEKFKIAYSCPVIKIKIEVKESGSRVFDITY